MTYLFGNGLIKCLNCGKNYRGKKQRNKVVYICSTYNRDSSKCMRFVIEEEELLDVIKHHVDIKNQWETIIEAKTEKELSNLVELVEVKDGGYRIIYKSGGESIINLTNEVGIKIKY